MAGIWGPRIRGFSSLNIEGGGVTGRVCGSVAGGGAMIGSSGPGELWQETIRPAAAPAVIKHAAAIRYRWMVDRNMTTRNRKKPAIKDTLHVSGRQCPKLGPKGANGGASKWNGAGNSAGDRWPAVDPRSEPYYAFHDVSRASSGALMGCCLLALFGAIWPRVVLALIYIFDPPIPRRAFQTALWPLLGFIFLPTTTLAYELCSVYIAGGMSNVLSIILVIIALLHDLGQFGSLRSRRRREV
jgi:hypothetical protein